MAGRIHKYSFLAQLSNSLVCGLCLEVAEEPWQHGRCGKLLCNECLERHGRDKPCPTCELEDPQYFEDNRSKKEIEALPIRCSNVDRQCEWEGTVDSLKQHLDTCDFALVSCPKKCRDAYDEVRHIMRKDLETHQNDDCSNRDYTCQYCEMKGTYTTIKVHDAVCAKKILPCLNVECDENIERLYFTEHLRIHCPHTVISCKYKGIGCKVKLKREDMAAHEKDNTQPHLQMALDTVNLLQDTVTTLKSKEESMTFALLEYQKNKGGTKMFKSPSFYTSPTGYHMEVRVYGNGSDQGIGTHVSVSILMLEGKNDPALKWPFKGKIIFQLLNQLEDENHHTVPLIVVNENDVKVESNWGLPTFIPFSALAHDPVKNTQYLVDDTLYFRVSVEVTDHKPWLQCTAK